MLFYLDDYFLIIFLINCFFEHFKNIGDWNNWKDRNGQELKIKLLNIHLREKDFSLL